MSEIVEFCSIEDTNSQIQSTVQEIINDIKLNGDEALIARTFLYDKVSLKPEDIPVTEQELATAKSQLSSEEEKSILEAIENITLFHEKCIPSNWDTLNVHGAKVGEKYYPIDRVGIYVPGGNVPLISTVLMTVCIAKVANVKEIAVVTPPDRREKLPHRC